MYVIWPSRFSFPLLPVSSEACLGSQSASLRQRCIPQTLTRIADRRPSGIAFGTSRPALAIAPIEDSPLSKVEKKQSRDAERSLLRDNHILPPKHPIVKPPSLLKVRLSRQRYRKDG